jgi:hypothetical protein
LTVAGGTPVTGGAVPAPVPNSRTEDAPVDVDVFVVEGFVAGLVAAGAVALGVVGSAVFPPLAVLVAVFDLRAPPRSLSASARCFAARSLAATLALVDPADLLPEAPAPVPGTPSTAVLGSVWVPPSGPPAV